MEQQNPVEYFVAVNKLANENQGNTTKQQTAVEWLIQQINLTFYVAEESEMNKRFQSIYEQAKAMEKEQIMDAIIENKDGLLRRENIIEAENYYNKTYNK